MFLNLYVWKCIQHKGWYYSLFLRVGLTKKISCIAILLWCESNFKNNTNLCDSITQKMLLDSLFVALVNYLEYYYAIIICLFTKIFPARGSKASTLLNGENSYLIRWINSFSLLLRDWSIQMKHYMTYYCWCIIPKTFWCNCRGSIWIVAGFWKETWKRRILVQKLIHEISTF